MYKIQELTENDYDKIRFLYRNCFNITLTKKEFYRKYYNDHKFRTIGYFAIDSNGNTGGFYGVFKDNLTYQNKSYMVAQSGDTMTHPAHQKKGLFLMLAKATYNKCIEDGIALIFGFPNKQSYHGFSTKLDWTFNGNMRRWTFTVNSFPWCELTSINRQLKSAYRKFAEHKIRQYKVKPTRIIADQFNTSYEVGMIEKSLEFFNFKLDNPSVQLLQFRDFILLVKFDNHLIIGDIGYKNELYATELMNCITQLGELIGCRKVVISLSLNHWANSIFENYQTSEDGLPIGFLNFNTDIDPSKIAFSYSDFDTF
ncbi:MAG: GNAT family N-acetyltransferase [Schleiferiaceae bacterium]|jgi:hypothetical protein|nr:GNAT family N-acetyltransferase [Schleiferiaceae bacterium]MDP4628670.1 GNAT family N-acetyltransferase [Schleiferiaceae bacterium]MDP4774457.1 GNAT family N-acetyltransferase [Schleiferiaceae bacterium]MDP4932122.1 GNAT family N-acetyltransferase [Schleiferiaceae bacterium]